MICSFQKLIYPNTEEKAAAGSYTVALYSIHGWLPDAHGNRVREAKVVGYYLPMVKDLRFDLTGHWSKGKYGMQFEMEGFQEIIQPGRAGMIAYLSSGLIKGIDKKTAETIYDAFGDQTLAVLECRPEELLKIRGIETKKLARIRDSFLASRGARDIVAVLAPHGVSADRAVKIYKAHGAAAFDMIKANPFCLCDMQQGIEFPKADSLARSMGLDPLSADRIIHTLKVAEGRGHLCLENQLLIKNCVKIIDTDGLTQEMVANFAYKLLCKHELVIYHGHTYRLATAQAEQSVADMVKRLILQGCAPTSKSFDMAIDEEQQKLGIELAPEQRRAVKSGLASRLCIISGGPGTGKTLIQSVLLKIYRKLRPDGKVVCCAPTGRAARRMEQCTGYPSSTVHKALGLLPGDENECDEPEDLNADLVIVDEVSMLDIYIARHLLKALSADCQLILIGDADQLPSVGPGAVLSELIESGKIPIVKLDHVFRQDSGSLIATNARRIRHNDAELDVGDDFVFYESPTFEQSAGIIERLYLAEISRVGVDNVALLTPFREKTETGVYALNARLREKINPPAPGKSQISYGQRMFRKGDKVMQIKNTRNVSNGDIGYLTEIEKNGTETVAKVDYGDGRIAEYEPQDLPLLELAYACTIHKSQGGEYRSVIVNIQTEHYGMLMRPLIYTAITRAKQRVIIVGERKALRTAIHSTDDRNSDRTKRRAIGEKRGTMLAARIIDSNIAPAANY